MDFKTSVNLIIERSGDHFKAKNSTKSAELSLLSSKLSFLPDLSLSLYKSSYDSKSSDYKGVNLKGTLNLWNSGEDLYRYISLNHSLTSARLNEKDIYLNDEAKAAQTLVKYISIMKKNKIYNKNIKLKKDSLLVIKSRYKKGIVPRNEVLKAEVDLSNIEADLADSEIDLIETRNNVVKLLGSDQVAIVWPWSNNLRTISREKLNQSKLILSERADIKMLNSTIKSANYFSKKVRAKLLPRIDFSIEREQIKAYSKSTWDTISTISLTIPLFSGLRDYSAYNKSKIDIINLKRDMILKERSANKDFISSKSELIKRIEMAKKREQNVVISRKVYQGNFKRFKKGLTSTTELQIDQSRLLNSEKLNINGQEQLHLAYINFCHSIGRSIFSCY
jgi:outer membrane protein TolC